MGIKILTGTYASGYTLNAEYQELVVSTSARVGGNGVYAAAKSTVINDGSIQATNANGRGVLLEAGGTVDNGSSGVNTTALISGSFDGVTVRYAAGRVVNYGTIQAGSKNGVYMGDGGVMINGSAVDTTALVAASTGYNGFAAGAVAMTVFNFGTIQAGSNAGVDLYGGGRVVNGSTTDTTALITGGLRGAVYTRTAATVINYGSIQGTSGSGVDLLAGGSIVNFGTVTATQSSGVFTGGGGAVTNGSATNGTALIIGKSSGFYASGAVTVTNFGTIEGTTGVAVRFTHSTGRLVAESGSTWIGSAVGGGGTLELANGSGTITGLGSAGTLSGAEALTFSGFGSYVIDTGSTWTLTGADSLAAGQSLTDGGALTNLGSLTSAGSDGVVLTAGGALTNGASGATGPLISGKIGVYAGATGAATVTNFGTIDGTGDFSVQFKSAADRLVAESGSTWIGVAYGGRGMLELASGSGTITGLGAKGTLSGAEAMTFENFGSYVIDAGSAWTVTGHDTLSAAQSLTDGGALTNLGLLTTNGADAVVLTGGATLTNSATALISGSGVGVYAGVTSSATVTNFGTIKGNAASVQFKSAADRLVAESGSSCIGTAQGGGGTLELANGTGTITGLGSTATLSGAEMMRISGFGTYVNDSGSTWTLTGTNTLASNQILMNGGALTNLGALTSSGNDGVVLTSGGDVTNGSTTDASALISGTASGVYAGAGGAATVINFGTIDGTGGVALQFESAADRLVAESGSTWIGAAQGGGGTLELANGTGTITGLGSTGTLSGAEALTFSGFGSYVIDTGSTWTLAGTNSLAAGQSLTDGGALTNLGALTSAGSDGVILTAGATLTNGSATDTSALISGTACGVYAGASGAATVINFGTIMGTGGVAVEFRSAADRLVAESGSTWIGAAQGGGGTLELANGTGTITRLGSTGTLSGAERMTFSGFGSYVTDTGSIWTLTGTNGLAAGQSLTDGGVLKNLGALTSAGSDAVVMATGGALTNGTGAKATTSILGLVGVYAGATGAATVTNFGTIDGTGGVAVQFASMTDKLLAESGSTWIGSVLGGGGLLDLVNGTGTVTGIGSTGTVSGAEAMTFSGFGSYEFGAGSWTLTGADILEAGQSMLDKARVTSTGALTLDGAVSSTGSLVIAAGTAEIDSGATIAVATLSLTGGLTSLDETLAFRGAFNENSAASLTVASGDKLMLLGTAGLSGLINGAGSVSAATATLGKGLLIGGTEALTLTGAATQTAVITIGDTTSSAASVTIANGATWTITGGTGMAEGTATTSSLRVAGTLVGMGVNAICAIAVATTDIGTIEANAGTLDFANTLSGTGSLTVASGAVLEVDKTAAKTLTITFGGPGATLALKAPTTLASTIAGYAVDDTIDLLNITATGASINSQDQLVIVDGAATVATLKLTGAYSGATFNVGSDNHGGTDLTLTAAGGLPPPQAPFPHAMIAAMAGLGAGGGCLSAAPFHVHALAPALMAPRTQLS